MVWVDIWRWWWWWVLLHIGVVVVVEREREQEQDATDEQDLQPRLIIRSCRVPSSIETVLCMLSCCADALKKKVHNHQHGNSSDLSCCCIIRSSPQSLQVGCVRVLLARSQLDRSNRHSRRAHVRPPQCLRSDSATESLNPRC